MIASVLPLLSVTGQCCKCRTNISSSMDWLPVSSYNQDVFNKTRAREAFVETLSKVDLISITGIPSSIFEKQDMMTWKFHVCTVGSQASTQHTFLLNRTVRHTFATHMTQKMFQDDLPMLDPCEYFCKASNSFALQLLRWLRSLPLIWHWYSKTTLCPLSCPHMMVPFTFTHLLI